MIFISIPEIIIQLVTAKLPIKNCRFHVLWR